MATEAIIEPTLNADESDPITVTATPATISVNGPELGLGSISGPDVPLIGVLKETSEDEWISVGFLTFREPAKQIVAAGTYKLAKPASAWPYGADLG